MDTKDIVLSNGRHKGERIQRVPVGYLLWMVNVGHDMAEAAQAELDRRGTRVPEVEISGHAIDRASLSCRRIWHQTALSKIEGIHAWLARTAKEALDFNKPSTDEVVLYNGMRMVFDLSGCWPVLKTVMNMTYVRPVSNDGPDAGDGYDEYK